MIQRSETDELPKNNPFFNLTPELRQQAERSLQQRLENEVRYLTLTGDGEQQYVVGLLRDVQKVLRVYKEYGYQVALLDEGRFPSIAEAIGPLKRAGLGSEIRRIMIELLRECFQPVPEESRPEVIQKAVARVTNQ